MKDGKRVVCVVPARGGSDTVPYLNIKRLGDRPLLAHTLEAAQGAPTLDRIAEALDLREKVVADLLRRIEREFPLIGEA